VREVTEGMSGTGVRAGIIGEIGTYQNEMTDVERRVFRAAARAAQETGVAVTTHTYLGELALEQIDVLTGAGLAPERIVIGHLDDLTPLNLDLAREIIRRGAWAEFDAVGCEYFTEALQAQMPTDLERLEALTTLAQEGLADRVILASDICRKRHLRVNGGPGLAHLAGRFRELAAEQGVPEELLDRVLRRNPATVLTMTAS
jgi:phosphotriesterase-related protein